MKKYRREKNRRFSKILLKDILILGVALSFFVTGGIVLWAATLKIPDFNAIDERKTITSAKIYDRTGEILLYDMHEEVKQVVVPFEEMSPYIKEATIAIEDAEFYNHIGIRPLSFIRATLANLTTGSLGQGGSTITQQVVKNTLLTQEKKVSRKIKEWILAVKLEQSYSKDQILALYLNESPYGGNIYGIEQASLSFYGKQAKDLSLPEAAYLAALPQRPTILSPYGNHLDLLEERKNLVLKRMLELGYITKEEHDGAVSTKVTFLPRTTHGIKAPHFVTWVREHLAELYDERELEENGYRVITTLDYTLQAEAERIVAEYGEENAVKFNAHNAGMVGIDPKTGDVLIMVGSRDYFDIENDGNFNTTLSPNRQPGSSFKPFVYATAFKEGYTPDTVLFNLRTQFSQQCDAYGNPLAGATQDSCFMPQNYDYTYPGPVTLRNALAQSMNIPAVKLLYLAGIKDSITTAKSMGITSLKDSAEYGLSLVLGSGSVSLLEMTSAYGVFANDGVRVPYQNILRIEDADGNVVRTFGGTQTPVLDVNVARQISDILSDNIARAPAFGDRSYLYFGDRDVAVKTGTTNDYRDAWIIGYTPSFVLGTWVGNNDNSSMEKKVAGYIVAPMWNAVMNKALVSLPNESFTQPNTTVTINDKPVLRGIWQGGEQYFVDSVSGKIATTETPSDLIVEKIVPNVHSILYWLQREAPRGPQPSNPYADPQFILWETAIQDWVQTNQIETTSVETVPTETDDVHVKENAPIITFLSPTQNSVVPKNITLTISIAHTQTYPLTRVEYFVNDVFVGRAENEPFSLSFVPGDIKTIREQNILKAVGYDSAQNSSETSIIFGIQ